MDVTQQSPWLLLVFSLPAKKAVQRVGIWRKLQRYGTLPLRSSGHLLPNTPMNQERMEWLATTIRAHKGQASVVQVQGFDDLPADVLKQHFIDARSRDYQKLIHEARKLAGMSPARRPSGAVSRIRRRFQEVRDIEFFETPLRPKLEKILSLMDKAGTTKSRHANRTNSGEYINRIWMTRPRPGIDRVSSAWFIRRFIDAKARFVFGSKPEANPEAIPFDMFCDEGFGHRGEDCTFETLHKQFAIRDSRVRRIAEVIHDADFDDEKFGRSEGQGLDKVLNGWAKQDMPDDELLERGMALIQGLYDSLA